MTQRSAALTASRWGTAVLAAFALAACSPGGQGSDDAPVPSAAPTTPGETPGDSLTPGESNGDGGTGQELLIPEATETEIGRFIVSPDGTADDPIQSGAYTATGIVEQFRPFVIEGECLGEGQIDFTVVTADPDRDTETLVTDALECGTGPITDPTPHALDYDGPVQIMLTNRDDGVGDGWILVVHR